MPIVIVNKDRGQGDMTDTTHRIDSNYLKTATRWSLIGILVTLVLGIPALYLAIRQPVPHVSFKVVRESNVLDLHQPVLDLTISYRGEDIKKKNKNLRIMTVRVENDGDTDIRQGDYDHKQPWGIRLLDADIVEQPKIVDSNSQYIRDNADPNVDKNNVIMFNKIILERGKFFVVEFQVLYDLTKKPRMEAVGKITGIETVPIIAADPETTQPGFWRKVFWGDATVQIVRIIVFAVGTIGLLILLIYVLLSIDERKEKQKQKEQNEQKEKRKQKQKALRKVPLPLPTILEQQDTGDK